MRLYVSARTEDARGYDGRLREEIARQSPSGSFSKEVERADALLLIIGPQWVREHPGAHSMLMDVHDPVRLDLEAALTNGLRVVPVLIRGATFPGKDDLPRPLHSLLQINASPISHQGFREDVKSLLAGLNRPERGVAAARIEVSTPNGVLGWFLEKEYRPVRLLIDGEDRAAMRMLNQSKAFEVDAGTHTITVRSTSKPLQERSVQVSISPGETVRLRASRSGWIGTLSLERLG